MPDELEDAGSSPACPTNAKAMCGAWLGAYALPGRLDPANLELFSLTDTPERRGRGGRNPATIAAMRQAPDAEATDNLERCNSVRKMAK